MGFLSIVDCIRVPFLSLSAIETSRVAPKTATALVIAVLTSTIFAISFLSGGGITYVPLTIEIFGGAQRTYRKAAAPIPKTILCLLFKFTSFLQSVLIYISYFSFLFISRFIALTISKNSSLVNIPFSTSNRVRHYPPNRVSLFYINCLLNLELAFEFVCPFIIREGAFYSNKVENLLASTVVADMSPNQLIVPYHGPYLWLTLKQKFPLV